MSVLLFVAVVVAFLLVTLVLSHRAVAWKAWEDFYTDDARQTRISPSALARGMRRARRSWLFLALWFVLGPIACTLSIALICSGGLA